jgi:glucose/arabinose dehydrogenase
MRLRRTTFGAKKVAQGPAARLVIPAQLLNQPAQPGREPACLQHFNTASSTLETGTHPAARLLISQAHETARRLPMTFLRSAAMASPLALFLAAPAVADYSPVKTRSYTLAVETVAKGLEHPWGMAFISNDRYLVTERNPGTIRVGTLGGELSEPVWKADDLFRYEGPASRSQGGLFDVIRHPDFENNRYVYISYSRATDRGAALTVVRARVAGEGDDVKLEDVEDIFVMKEDDQDSSGLHFGGRMAFGPDNMLYLTVGERRNISRSQDPSDQAGSVLRMTDTGEAPEDNPKFQSEKGESDPYVFAVGIRNIQALGVNPATGELWAADHGPQGGDEINLIAGGNNYGWPHTTGGKDYSGAPLGAGLSMEGMTPPVHVFDETVAPSGLTFVTQGPRLQTWEGDMLIGALRPEGIMRICLNGNQVAEQELIAIGRRIRDVKIGPDGAIYALTEHKDGEVLRLSEDGGEQAAPRG